MVSINNLLVFKYYNIIIIITFVCLCVTNHYHQTYAYEQIDDGTSPSTFNKTHFLINNRPTISDYLIINLIFFLFQVLQSLSLFIYINTTISISYFSIKLSIQKSKKHIALVIMMIMSVCLLFLKRHRVYKSRCLVYR